MRKNIWIFSLLGLFLPWISSAHENYVLPHDEITRGMHDWSANVFSALKSPENLKIALTVGLIALIGLVLYYFFSVSRMGLALHEKLQKLEPLGHTFLRITLGASFIASGVYGAFLGPEIALVSLPLGVLLAPLLVGSGILLVLGLFTETASLVGLMIFIITLFVDHTYMFTYLNYLGELVVLVAFGSRYFSLDKLWSKASQWREKYKKYEIPLIRITYGISIIYPAIAIKLLHPNIIVEIVNQYHLNQFHWLFPSDPLLVALGTGLTEVAVGLLIVIGFATRLAGAITFGLYVLSIAFFREAVWPHYILLALSFYLVINDGGGYSIDSWLRKRKLK